jgi:cytochrome c oxidase subunit IV
MKTEAGIFGGVALFLVLACAGYAWWTWYDTGAIEWIGSIALLLSFLLTAMIGGYFWVVARRIDLRPEDRADAEVSDGAGDVGFFSPGSYYPFGIAAAASTAALGLVFWMWWLIVAGVLGVVCATAGLLFEYHTGTRRTAAQ